MKLLIAITDAPGAAYGLGLQAYLSVCPEVETYTVVPDSARNRILAEMRWTPDMADRLILKSGGRPDGAFPPSVSEVDGVILAPCSMETLAAVARMEGRDWLQQAVISCLKRRRPVITLVTLSHLGTEQLEFMLQLSRKGVTILSCPDAHLAPGTSSVMWCEAVNQALDMVGVGRPVAGWGAA